MASLRTLKGHLVFDFRYQGKRHREFTSLADTPVNRRKMEKMLEKLEIEIATGSFDYVRFFSGDNTSSNSRQNFVIASQSGNGRNNTNLKFAWFADVWFRENEVSWKRSYRETVKGILDKHLLPAFGQKAMSTIQREELLAFRAALAKQPGRKNRASLSPARINTIMLILSQCLNEAADRYHFPSPCHRIKPLKVPKSDIHPFTLDEVRLILNKVRPDYKNYYTVRFFTGMRTGEIDGLKWSCIDFERRLITVRTTIVRGDEETTKTNSIRDIQMSELVYQALQSQQLSTAEVSEYVFCNLAGQPLNHNNVTKRVWYPLLRHLGLRIRCPYQTRHTAATLWLAAGENPEWIARQLGHANTEMLFTTYSRYIPNLTRRDGSAFESMLASHFEIKESQSI